MGWHEDLSGDGRIQNQAMLSLTARLLLRELWKEFTLLYHNPIHDTSETTYELIY